MVQIMQPLDLSRDLGDSRARSLAHLEWQVSEVLHRRNLFGSIPTPASGYYQIIKQLFDELNSLYSQNFSCRLYFFSLRVSYWCGTHPDWMTPHKDVWQTIFTPLPGNAEGRSQSQHGHTTPFHCPQGKQRSRD